MFKFLQENALYPCNYLTLRKLKKKRKKCRIWLDLKKNAAGKEICCPDNNGKTILKSILK